MGFFGALGKIMSGKPVYENKPGGNEDPAYSGPESGLPSAAGPKFIPVVRIGRVENRISGNRLDIYADIHNQSNEALFLDRVFFIGIKRELDSQLRPGEARQFIVYSGPLLMRQPDGYAELQYRKQSDGDYFANYHQVRSRQEGSNWQVSELLMQGPVKDI